MERPIAHSLMSFAAILILLWAVIACGCTNGPGPEPTPPHAVDLKGVTWHLISYDDGTGTGTPVLEGTDITVFFAENGEMDGSAGCNHYFATYTVDGDAITIGPLAITEMACLEPEGVMAQETAYVTALGRVATYQVSAYQLTMRDEEGNVVLEFTEGE